MLWLEVWRSPTKIRILWVAQQHPQSFLALALEGEKPGDRHRRGPLDEGAICPGI
ncbi:hypothetical protein [Laspinema olomoucense]|uniref:Uncharacterized protein n=1 Tax=Laspinema olomoucense D3b TaxID=2953688 RepID=A0ABT2N176_9CYAN|nr:MULTISPECIES: hypothetical protein [unclassified Laspinema]MCT7971957.1 hypothetical protein [Laspinema sp. D3d]MCT7976428.1 hypothetical protein [Laspinema sp. D3b]MCT7994587.1 hypothetical protein [Laspinema sp. D3c]